MRTTFKELLDQDGAILADGAMGTMLFSLGLEHGDPPEIWNVDHPDRVQSVHEGYIESGSQIILTNTFGGNRLRLNLHNLSDRVSELNQAAARNAGSAAEAARRPVAVAGSMGPTGGLLKPLGDMTFEQAADAFEEQAAALIAGGADVLWIETMSDLGEVRAAIEGARRAARGKPIVATMTFDTAGHTMMGVSPEAAVQALREFDLAAIGANCGNGVEEIEAVIQKMHAADPGLVLVAKANAGIPRLEKGVPVYDASPEMMGEYAIRVLDSGARIIGGCCGSTTHHVRAMKDALAKGAGTR
jgi:methionine synthase I (cobalamin-dependent)